jgi:branched-chain amino acid aminotransferase
MNFICFNGNFKENKPLFTPQNRSFRYGDGVFETMKVYHGKILFQEFHFERLLLSLHILQIENHLEASQLSSLISELCKKNNCLSLSRIRLAVYRNEKNNAEFVIEAFSISDQSVQWNENGFTIDIYPYARKSMDAFANLKTANFLPYVMAERFAKEKNLEDSIVLNGSNHLSDTSKANVFLIKNEEIFTPALHQGCINGVMRRFLLQELKRLKFAVHQKELAEKELAEADEVFLTNSIFDMRWVRRFRKKEYGCKSSFDIYKKLIAPLYA